MFNRYTHALIYISDGEGLRELGSPAEDVAQDPTSWPLGLGDTLVVYHPHAERPPQVIPTRELTTVFSGSPDDREDQLPLDDSGRPPYFPFKTLTDFEQAELFVKRDCTDSHINDQLALRRRHPRDTGITLKNAREMHQYLQAAGNEEDLSQVAS